VSRLARIATTSYLRCRGISLQNTFEASSSGALVWILSLLVVAIPANAKEPVGRSDSFLIAVAEAGKPWCFGENIPILDYSVDEGSFSFCRWSPECLARLARESRYRAMQGRGFIWENRPFWGRTLREPVQFLIPSFAGIGDWPNGQNRIHSQDTGGSSTLIFSSALDKYLFAAFRSVRSPSTENDRRIHNPCSFRRSHVVNLFDRSRSRVAADDSLPHDCTQGENQCPRSDTFGPCHEFVPPLRLILAVVCFGCATAINGYGRGWAGLLYVLPMLCTGWLILDGHRYWCKAKMATITNIRMGADSKMPTERVLILGRDYIKDLQSPAF
jgi:hypothetical protein